MADRHDRELPESYRWLLRLDPEVVKQHTTGVVRELIELIGVEPAFRVIWRYQGLQFYLPMFDRSVRKLRDIAIHTEFDGTNYAELARRYGMGQRNIRHILEQDEFRQSSLFAGLEGETTTGQIPHLHPSED